MRRLIIALAGIAALGAAVVFALGNNRTGAPATTDPSEAASTPSSLPATDLDLAPLDPVEQIEGDAREGGPSALRDRNHPEFPPALVDVGEIRSGGPAPDGIPPIDRPDFEQAAEVDWLEPNEPVVVLEVDGETRAYPVQIMTWHEIVNDTFGDTPVTITYCPLCNSAVAYDRRLDDRVLDFGTSGRLFRSSLVMYDRQTESLWTHFEGQAVVGTLTGSRLTLLPVATVSWEDFRREHPAGRVLSRNTGFPRPYGQNPYAGYDDPDGYPFLFDGNPDPRLPPMTRVVAVRGEAESFAVVLDDLAEAGVLTANLDGEPIVVFHVPGTTSALDRGRISDGRDIGSVAVFHLPVELTDQTTPPAFTSQPDGTVTEESSGLTIDVFGRGQRDGGGLVQLEPVEHLDTFWFAISAFEPAIAIVAP